MQNVLVITTGRADAVPLWPVVQAMRAEGIHVNTRDVGPGAPYSVVTKTVHAFDDNETAEAVVVLGDRWELLYVCADALKRGIPIIHIHGGEATAGSFDDLTRDAVSKMASLHFVAHTAYADHLNRIGECEHFVVGAPGLDNLLSMMRATKEEIDRWNQCVATWHPVTLADESVEPLIESLAKTDLNILWTQPNNDPGWQKVVETIGNEKICYMDPHEFRVQCSRSRFVIGNSSMGIIEAPAMFVPSINIGTRQDGRLRSPSVIDCENTVDAILAAIAQASVYDGPFHCPFGTPGMVSRRIARIIASRSKKGLVKKRCESL